MSVCSAPSTTGNLANWRFSRSQRLVARGVQLPSGEHLYRFWLENASQPQGFWLPDPENPVRAESGYADAHSVVEI